MAFTPTYIRVASLGSLKLTIAETNGATATASDSWASAIPDIVAILPYWNTSAALTTPTSITASWTASSGTIWIVKEAVNTATAFNILVLSGMGQRV